MGLTLPNLGLKVWNLPTDPYDSEQLAENWARVDQHDHTAGKGLPIGTSAIEDGAITSAKIAAGAIPTFSLADGSVTTPKLANEAVDTAKLGVNAVDTQHIQDDAVTDAKLASGGTVPLGVILPYGGAAAPDANWLLCQGQLISTVTYAALFGVLGHVYNAGGADPGGGQFRLPDLQGRVPVGKGSTGATDTRGETGGSEPSNMPNHDHGGVTAGRNAFHQHPITYKGIYSAATGVLFNFVTVDPGGTPGSLSDDTPDHAHAITAQGSGGDAGNMMPYQVINYIIRAIV